MSAKPQLSLFAPSATVPMMVQNAHSNANNVAGNNARAAWTYASGLGPAIGIVEQDFDSTQSLHVAAAPSGNLNHRE